MRKFLSTTALALCLPLCPAAFAEDGEIVVTGVPAPTPAERLPARVEVIDRAEIEARGLVSLVEAIGSQAVQAGGAGQQASLFLRGANSNHVLALLDGIRVNDASTPNGQYDFGLDTLGGITRVEVLRGPASALYGSDALGGVVNVIPRRGGETPFEPFAEAAAGSFTTWRALVGAAGEIQGFEYGLSAEAFETDGYDLVPARMRTHTGDADGAGIRTFTASARHDMGALAVDVLLRARETEAEFDSFSSGPFFSLRADDPDLENSSQQNLWRLGADLASGGALTWRLAGGQVSGDRDETDGGFTANTAQASHSFLDASARYAQGDASLVAGLAIVRDDIDTQPQFASPLSVAEDQSALYLNGQQRFAGRFDVTASLRIDEYESFGAQSTYALGMVGDFAPLRLFASYGTAFKAPSLSQRFEVSFFNRGNRDLRPEESRSWEIGADWRAGEALTLGASYYQTRIDDLIQYNFFARRNVNIGQAAIDGAEVHVEAKPISWSSLRLDYAWTDARNELTNSQLLRRPEHAWRIEARATPTERITIALAWSFVGERGDVTYDDGGDFLSAAGRVESFSIGALSASFDLDARAQLFARIDNLTDETYEQPAAFAGAPRSGTIGVRARF